MATSGPFTVGETFDGNHRIDQICRHVALHYTEKHQLKKFRMTAGNDETVWEAPGMKFQWFNSTAFIEMIFFIKNITLAPTHRKA